MSTVDTATEFHFVGPNTLITADGEGPVFEIGQSPRLFVLQMDITEVVDQESIELSIWGSPNANDWGTQPLLKFPQRFYRGGTRMVLDLLNNPAVRFVRARWQVNRWGRGRPEPHFRFGVVARPIEM